MRLPEESQLSREQKEVCSSPPEGTLLVVGPPGSGKTVVAIFQKKLLEAMGEPVVAVAHNNVLARYGGLDRTFQSWHNDWWQKATNETFPFEMSSGFRRPMYKAALEAVMGDKKAVIAKNGNWGHLVLDEAQDFPTTAHSLLAWSRITCEEIAEDPPSILLLADENQRITKDENSTIEEIRKAHMMTADDVYYLKRNYRNTREIAKVAAHFYVGTASGIPDLPEHQGDRPKLLTACPIDHAVKRIANHARTHDDEEIGILVYHENTRKKLFNKLKHRLAETDIRVQTYFWDTRKGGGKPLANRLTFDSGGTITVLCFNSAKGLEFDTVFLPELQQMGASDVQGEISKMQLYVMASRARRRLTFTMDDPDRRAPVWSLLPGGNLLNELFEVG